MEENTNVPDVSENDSEIVQEPVPEPEVSDEELQTEEEVEDTLAGEESDQEIVLPDSPDPVEDILDETVSNGDVTVSGGNFTVDNYTDYSEALSDIHAELQLLNVPIWDKPIEDYTVAEGLLLCSVLLLIALLIGKIFRGGEKYV